MAIDNALVQLLVCPDDKQWLEYIEAENILYNPRLRRAYEVKDGIPVLLINDARSVDETQHARLSELIDSGASVRTGNKEHA